MKKLSILAFLILCNLFVIYGQKTVKTGFLIYKLPEGGDPTNETGSRFSMEGDSMNYMVGYSEYFNPEDFINEYFVYDDKDFKTVETKKLEFKKYLGHTPQNEFISQPAELYLYEKGDLYIAVVKTTENNDNEKFLKFLNSIKINPKALKWKTDYLDIFSISLPEAERYFDFDYNLEYFDIGLEQENDPYLFHLYISEDSPDHTIDTLTEDRILFSVKSNGSYYRVEVDNEFGYRFSKGFYERINAGITPYNFQPKGEVIKVSNTWPIENDVSFYEWDWLFVYNGKSVSQWNIRRDYINYKYKGLKSVPVSICDLDYEYTYIGMTDGSIGLYDFYGDLIDIQPTGHSDKVNRIKYVNDFGVVSCSDDKTLKVWSTDIYNPEPIFVMEGHSDAVTCFDNLDEFVVSGSKDKTLRIWDFKGNEVSVLNFHSAPITAVKCFEKINVVSASNDGEVILWNSRTKEKEGSAHIPNGFVTCFDDQYMDEGFYTDFIAAGTSEGEIIIWEKGTMKEIARYNDTKPIKLLRFYRYGVMSVNSANELKYWDVPSIFD